jgi:carboxymethylenebutenolidase
VPFYGPAPPIEQIPNTNAAILAIYAGNDTRINQSIPQVEDALKKAGKTYEIKVYPDVNHAFHNDTGASWNEPAAVDAWKQAMAWFKKQLG